MEAVVGQPPDPHGPVGDDQGARGLAEAAAARLGVELLAQRVDPAAGGGEAALGDDGPAAGGLAAVVQPEAGAGVDPMPAFGLGPAAAAPGALAPCIALADVPGVDLQDRLVGFQQQLELAGRTGRRGRLGVERLSHGLRAVTLAAGLAVERGARHFNSGEPFQDQAGLGHGHLAGEQRGHLLHAGRVTGALRQAQRRVGGDAPFAALRTEPARAPHGDLPGARREGAWVIDGEPRQWAPTLRTDGRRRVGPALRALRQRLPRELLRQRGDFRLEMAQIFLGTGGERLDALAHRRRHRGGHGRKIHRHRHPFRLPHRLHGSFHSRSLHPAARN